MSEFEPKIIAFLCNWCSYAGADLAGVSRYQYPTNTRTVRVMCSTRISPKIVLTLFRDGADGVLVTGCHIGDCHYINGNYYTTQRFDLTKQLLGLTGMDTNRLRLEWVSASEGEKFAKTVTDFTNKIKELGPTPVSGDVMMAVKLRAACEASNQFRVRVLNAKEVKLAEKGNVYGDCLNKESYDSMCSKAVEDEYERSLILQLAHRTPLSVKELAVEIGEPTERTLEHVVALRSRNMLALDKIEGTSPKYKAIVTGAD
jgi:F420-non-reducing hydrogenase iron-sulfur subunit